MASTANQLAQVREALNWAYCQNGLIIPWNRTQIDPELSTLDTFKDTNDITVNNTFTAGFRAQTAVADRALISITLDIRRRLVTSPTQLAVLNTILNRVTQ